MRIVEIDDPADPRLGDFLQLRDVQMRTAREPAEGFFLAEGALTIRRALAAGYHPRSVLATERWAAELGDVDATTYVVPLEVLRTTTGYPVHRGALASFDRRPLPPVEAVLADRSRIVVLEDLVDHTNVGAIFRSAAALGWHGVVVTPRCGDPLYRRAVRTSMGAVFMVPWTKIDHATGLDTIRAAGFTVVALTPDDATDIGAIRPPARCALIVGTEGPGVSAAWLASSDLRARIPMHAGIDSLNVSTAAAIALYALA
jgi:tRNA G18 (ribose-2'-O)-methylase SpoU